MQEEREGQAKEEIGADVRQPAVVVPQLEPRGPLENLSAAVADVADPLNLRGRDYGEVAMERWSKRKEPPQPGRSGTGADSGVPFSTPGPVPAADLPTQEGARRQAAGKPQGPSGLIGADRDTAAATRQRGDERLYESRNHWGPAEYAREARLQEHGRTVSQNVPTTAGDIAQSVAGGAAQDSMDVDFLTGTEAMVVMAVMGADSKSYKREHRRAAKMILSEIYSPRESPRFYRECRATR